TLAAARGARSSHHIGWAHTSFTQVLPASELAFALWLEARRLSALKHLDDVPEQPASEGRDGLLLLEPRHGALSMLERRVLGRPSIDLTAWQRLSRHFFSPEHAVLTVTGDFDLDQATRLVREYFGRGIAPDARSPAPHAPLPAPARRLTLSESFAGSRALALGYAAPALAHVDHAALV